MTNKTNVQGCLYIVSVPIGNDKDITLRALEILKEVDYIAAEDTRKIGLLLSQHNITKKKFLTHHSHNEKESSRGIIDLIRENQSVALVSDAGTAQIADPGFELIRQARNSQIEVIAIPGVSALTTALSLSTLSGKGHIFVGFLPAKKTERIKTLRSLSSSALSSLESRLVFFEAPHRLLESLKDCLEIWGDIQIEIFRELTKPYQQYLRQSIKEMIAHFEKNSPKGEFVVIAEPPVIKKETSSDIEKEIIRLLQNNNVKQTFELLQQRKLLPRKKLYQLILDLSKQAPKT